MNHDDHGHVDVGDGRLICQTDDYVEGVQGFALAMEVCDPCVVDPTEPDLRAEPAYTAPEFQHVSISAGDWTIRWTIRWGRPR